MQGRFNSVRKCLLPLLAAPILCHVPLVAQSNATQPDSQSGKELRFTIVSVKPHGNAPAGTEGCNLDACHFVNRPLHAFLMVAYDLPSSRILGDPPWAYEESFDLDARIDPTDLPTTPLSSAELSRMLQPVLADRFQLRAHHEMRNFPVYRLVVTRGGVKMKESAPLAAAGMVSPGSTLAVQPRCTPKRVGNGLRLMRDCAMLDVARILESPSGRSVIDETRLGGRYDFELQWTPDNTPADSPADGGPSIFTAVQEQLGLKLEPSSAPIDVVVLDSAQKPMSN